MPTLVDKVRAKAIGINQGSFLSNYDASNKGKPYLCGRHSYFIKVNRKWGWKGTVSATHRDKMVRCQKYLYSIGLSVEVGGMLNLTIDGDFYYGYFTRQAKILRGFRRSDNFGKELFRQFKIRYSDCGPGNIGQNENGDMVIIDCDPDCITDKMDYIPV